MRLTHPDPAAQPVPCGPPLDARTAPPDQLAALFRVGEKGGPPNTGTLWGWLI